MESPSETGLITVEQHIDSEYWTIQDLSKYLKVKIKTLYSMTSEIPHYQIRRLIRFKKADIDAWMEDNRIKAGDRINQSKKIKCKQSKGNIHIDKLITKAIDQSKNEVYNLHHGKSDRIKGLIKETNNESI